MLPIILAQYSGINSNFVEQYGEGVALWRPFSGISSLASGCSIVAFF